MFYHPLHMRCETEVLQKYKYKLANPLQLLRAADLHLHPETPLLEPKRGNCRNAISVDFFNMKTYAKRCVRIRKSKLAHFFHIFSPLHVSLVAEKSCYRAPVPYSRAQMAKRTRRRKLPDLALSHPVSTRAFHVCFWRLLEVLETRVFYTCFKKLLAVPETRVFYTCFWRLLEVLETRVFYACFKKRLAGLKASGSPRNTCAPRVFLEAPGRPRNTCVSHMFLAAPRSPRTAA